MPIERIAMIGATGTLGRPVAGALMDAGYQVTAVTRHPAKAAALGVTSVAEGDVFDAASLRSAFAGADAVYINLSISPDEKPTDRHAETHGLRNIIEAAKANRVRRLAMVSSLVKDYQGHDGFDWWAFDVKHQAVRLLRESGIPSTVFRPSSFFENFLPHGRSGNRILLPGKSKHPMWFIAGSDYGKQVARSFAIEGDEHRSFPVQGPEPFTYGEAARVFAENYPHQQLEVKHPPMLLLYALGLFSRKYDYAAKIVEALNEYPERFISQETWDELGKPTTTLAEWTKTAP